jgi:hypothetical protein
VTNGLLLAIVGALAGCNYVFGIDDTIERDAGQVVFVHDEDGDGIGDGSDNCPGIPNADQLNTEAAHDPVGDVCDEHPTDGVDSILSRAMFDDDLANWLPTPASEWILADDGVTNGGGLVLQSLALVVPPTNPTIEVRFTVLELLAVTQRVVALELRTDTLTSCWLVSRMSDGATEVQVSPPGGAMNSLGFLATPLVENQTYRIRFTRDASGVRCTDGAEDFRDPTPGNIRQVTARIGFSGIRAKVQYLVLYGDDRITP